METFEWPCDPSQIDEQIVSSSLITQFVIGPEQRRQKGRFRRRWVLRFRKGQVDGDAIWSFYIARRGAYEAFLWQSPLNGQTYTVRFEQDEMSRTVLWRAVFETGLSLIEVIT